MSTCYFYLLKECDFETRTFHVLDVLSIVTERLVAPSKMDAVYEITNWMTRKKLSIVEVVQASYRCKSLLLQLFPELQPAEVASEKSLDEWIERAPTCPDEGVKMWLTELKMMFPNIKDTYDVPRIPVGMLSS